MQRDDEIPGRSGLARPASKRSAIDPFIVMDVMRAANARDAEAARGVAAGMASSRDRVIHMEVGQPGTPAPRFAREAALRAMEGSTLGYTEALGLPELRARIARLYQDWYGLDIAPERVIVTAGSSGAFILAFLSLFDVGDTLALPAPGYPCYRHISSALGLKTHTLVTTERGRWMPYAKEIAELATAGTIAGLLLASPANPTGTMLAPDRLAAIAQTCRARGIWFISDEIYHGLTYEAPARTALHYSDHAIIINSFSKYFSMTGWRIGWMVVPEGLVRPIERLAQNLFICPPAIAQHAALGAFEATEELEGHRKAYAANRAILLEELPKAGLTRILPADGAFYVYADISDRAASSRELTKRMLDEIGIAATPGNDFDPARGEQFVRFSYAGTTADIAEAARRLKGWLGNQSRKG